MRGLTFEQVMEKETFEQYLSRMEDLTERIKRMEKRIEEVAQGPCCREKSTETAGISGDRLSDGVGV
jgi:putative component of toxin-antitoxin plasmid stabilization module